MNEPHTVLFLRGLNPHVKDHFKAWCAKRGTSMTRQIEAWMEKAVAEDAKTALQPRKRRNQNG